MNPREITITCHENEVPSFVGDAMDRLYGNIFSSIAHFNTFEGALENTSTYVARKGDQITALFLLKQHGGTLQVMNEVIKIDSEELSRFADYIFATRDAVNVITFKAIETEIQRFACPYQRHNCLEDIAMKLPDTADAYLASLGKNTRRNIKRYSDRLKRTFPTFRFAVYAADEVDEQRIREVIQFNRARMANKNKLSVIDEEETQRIVQRARACGLVGIATIDGRVCAGAISYRAGKNFFLDVLAHDPTYDDYWIGILCCYLTIRECIARGGKEFHFLWGRYEYKFALGAVPRDLDELVIYRSRLQILLNSNIALLTASRGYLRKAKLWHAKSRHRHTVISLTIVSFANCLKSMKEFFAEIF